MPPRIDKADYVCLDLIRANAALHVCMEASGYRIASERRLERAVFKARIENHHTLYAPANRRAAVRKQCGQSAGFYKGRKLSIDATEVVRLSYEEKLGPAVTRADPNIGERASITCSVSRTPVPSTGMPMPIELRFSVIGEAASGNYALSELLTARELGTS